MCWSRQRRQVASGKLPQVGHVDRVVVVEVHVGQEAGVRTRLQVRPGEQAQVGDVHPLVAVAVPEEPEQALVGLRAEHVVVARRAVAVAVELLAVGKTDKEAARALNLPAERVAKWRLYDPVFQAALNACRSEVWQASIDRLRSMIPQALDTLAEELNQPDNPDRCKVALDILRLAKLPEITPQGPADPETIVRQAVNRER